MKRAVTALLAGGAVFAGATAFAASLGGINPALLGADDAVVTSCDSDGITVAYGVDYDGDTNIYELDTVTLNGVSGDCEGKAIEFDLTDKFDASVENVTGTVTLTSNSQVFTLPEGQPAEEVTGIHVVISDAAVTVN